MTVRIDSSPPSVPAFTGIRAHTYLPATLPSAKAVGCTASDPTSDVSGCSVRGFGKGFGAHSLTATATNGAGLTTTSTLGYVVAKPVAVAQLKLTKLGLAKLRSSGLTLRVRVAAASTHLVVKLTALVPNASGDRYPTADARDARQEGLGGYRDAARQAHCEGRGAPERAHEDDRDGHAHR